MQQRWRGDERSLTTASCLLTLPGACQTNLFGGWPEKKEDLPLEVLVDDLRETMIERCTALDDSIMPDLPSGYCAEEEATTDSDTFSGDPAHPDASDDESCTVAAGAAKPPSQAATAPDPKKKGAENAAEGIQPRATQ